MEPTDLSSRDTGTAAGRAAWPRLLTIGILFLAGFFDAISGNPVDAVLLGGVAMLLWRYPDPAAPVRGDEPTPRLRLRLVVVAALGALGYAAIVGGLGRYTWPMTLGVLAPGLGGLVLAWRGRRRRDPGPSLRIGQVVPWLAVALGVAGFELVNLFLQPGLTIDSYDHPTLSVLWEATGTGVGETLALLAWLGVGVYLVDR